MRLVDEGTVFFFLYKLKMEFNSSLTGSFPRTINYNGVIDLSYFNQNFISCLHFVIDFTYNAITVQQQPPNEIY